ncbi:hypothetical protein NQ318_008349 [Aromia moschata]|uniref:Uncharacterized protein n=1 Tax=Aromia moschata TaxID=1265417 RepID=A0AAV8YIE4_9CUCU|nr:hypothetical protein NQ318_008349 [Aromia moschata]
MNLAPQFFDSSNNISKAREQLCSKVKQHENNNMESHILPILIFQQIPQEISVEFQKETC